MLDGKLIAHLHGYLNVATMIIIGQTNVDYQL